MADLLDQALQTLAAKGAIVQRCPALAGAAEAIRNDLPADVVIAVHGSTPPGLLQHLGDRTLTFPAKLGEGGREALLRADAGLTGATAIVARTGSVILAEADGFGRAISNMAPVHIVVAAVADVVDDIYDGVERARQWAREAGRPAPPFMTIISGPSRTADIEFVLVKGAHGPVEVRIYLVDQV